MITYDCETVRFDPGLMAPPLVCMSTVDASNALGLVSWREAEDVAAAFLDGGGLLVGHGVSFDFAVLAANFPRLRSKIFAAYDADRVSDTAIRAKLIDLAEGSLGWGSIDGKRSKFRYSLDELARRHFGIGLAKGEDTWRTRYAELRDVPLEQWPDDAREYAKADAAATCAIWHEQEARRELFVDEARQVRSDFWIRLMSVWGMTTSPTNVAAFEAEARANYERLAAVLVAAGLKRPDPGRVHKSGKHKGKPVVGARDTKAVAALVVAAYAAKGEPCPMTDGTEKSAPVPCTDEEACAKSGDPLLAVYGEFGSAIKTLRTDVPLVRAGMYEPIHAHFEVLLETGDIGCSKPNLVNLPTQVIHAHGCNVKGCKEPAHLVGVRECFVPRPGFVLLAGDYAQIQLRTWSQVCLWTLGYSEMSVALNEGRDPHTMVAANLLGITEAEAMHRKEHDPASIYFERQCGKVSNFGNPGGIGPDRLVDAAARQYGVIISREKAVELKAIWKATWREAGPYLDMISRMTDNGNITITQFISNRIRGDVNYCGVANGLFSSLNYEGIKAAGWLVAKACYLESEGSVLFGSRTENSIHDELLLEVPEDVATECADELARLMVAGAAPYTPDVPPLVETTLMRKWSKKAFSKRGKDGRLSVWG